MKDEVQKNIVQFTEQISRKDQTADIWNQELKYMHQKTSDEIEYAQRRAYQQRHLNKNSQNLQDNIDWNTENNLQKFTMGIDNMKPCIHIYRVGTKLMKEKVELELEDETQKMSSYGIGNKKRAAKQMQEKNLRKNKNAAKKL